MSRTRFKWFQNLESITPTFNAIFIVGDTFQTILNKVQGLLVRHSIREVVNTTATGAVNTTADYDMCSLVIPVNTLQVGDIIDIDIYSLVKKGTGAMNILYWLKVNGTKSANLTYALGNAALDSIGMSFRAKLQVRSIGGGNTILTHLEVNSHNLQPPLITGSNVVPTFTVSTDSSITITAGANFSVADAANSIRPVAGYIQIIP